MTYRAEAPYPPIAAAVTAPGRTPASVPAGRGNLPVLTPGLRRLLALVLLLTGLLTIDSLYLLAISLGERATGRTLENLFYLDLFLAHLGLGLLLATLTLWFAAGHFRRARWRPNRYAIAAGLLLYLALLALFGSGLLLTRFGFLEVNDAQVRATAYWVHVLSPLAVAWLFVLHRLAGPRLRWRAGLRWAGAAVVLALLALGVHLASPGPPALVPAWTPALTLVPAAGPIPAAHLQDDATCGECHAEIAARHAGSMHRFSSFNNPAYRFAVDEARARLLARDGTVTAARLCAACHDPVPLFSGRFDAPDYDPAADPAGSAGITCLVCHAISAVNGPRGNGDYSIVDPPRYPFAERQHPLLRYLNRQLIKAKPAFHRQTMLKPLHREPEFCSTCHKVHLPTALNDYRWLRGQNHYDSFLLSGVSGHRVDSFDYPPRASTGCNDCHMPAYPAADPAARLRTADGARAIHDHLFAAANTGVAAMLGRPAAENAERVAMLARAASVDLFGLVEDGHIEGRLLAPLRPQLPLLEPGRAYLLEVVVRTRDIGHELTQGTADSNEVWLELTVSAGGRLLGRSGARDATGAVDDWAWFGNAYLLDRAGERIERRNAQDIFVALYDHQIPPGAAAVVHYALTLPEDLAAPVEIEAALRYRKFDTRFYRHLRGSAFSGNPLPITTLAEDRLVLPVAGMADGPPTADPNGSDPRTADHDPPHPTWERWNDYGIGLFRQGPRGQSRQAEAAFRQVEALAAGTPHPAGAQGALNLARVLHREGRLDAAAAALQRAADQAAPPWVLAWLTALIARDQGDLDRAIDALEALAETRFQAARARGFDFSRDYRLLTELGRTLYERARQARGETEQATRTDYLTRARDRLQQALALDPEHAAAHHNLGLVLADLGDAEGAARQRALHEHYRTDDNAVEQAVTRHRARNPAANHAAEVVAIYPLRPDPAAPAKPPPDPDRTATAETHPNAS